MIIYKIKVDFLFEEKLLLSDNAHVKEDPLDQVMKEGGPYHVTREDDIDTYNDRLRATGRSEIADRLESRTEHFRS